MADTLHFHVLLSLCSGKTKPNQLNKLKGLKTNGWWNNSNSRRLNCAPFLQSVTAIEHSWTPRLHAPTKEDRLRKALQWVIQTLQRSEERILICLWRLLSSPPPPTVTLCMESLLLLSVKMSDVTWTGKASLWCWTAGEAEPPYSTFWLEVLAPAHLIGSLSFLQPALWSSYYAQEFPLPAAHPAFPLGSDSNHIIWFREHSPIEYDHDVDLMRLQRCSYQREFLTLCLVFSLSLQGFEAPCPDVLLRCSQLWTWGGCRVAGLKTCSEGLTGPLKNRVKRPYLLVKSSFVPVFNMMLFLNKNITSKFWD